MSDELPPGVGTVGEEMTRLLAALAARQKPAERAEPGDGPLPHEDLPEEAGDGRLRRDEGEAQPPAAEGQSDCTCGCHTGAVPMGQAQVCSLCPVCQGIATLRALNPDLLDRLAQLAALAAETLRELAADAAAGRAAPRPERPRPPRPNRAERVDIDVVDEPSGAAPDGDEAQG